eukprot:1494120-Pyramimonas_sp.AAC.1
MGVLRSRHAATRCRSWAPRERLACWTAGPRSLHAAARCRSRALRVPGRCAAASPRRRQRSVEGAV